MADTGKSPPPESSASPTSPEATPPKAADIPTSPKAPQPPRSPTSPTTAEQQPGSGQQSPPELSPEAGILPASHWQPLENVVNDADSAYSDAASSTASLTQSILEYRTLHGRTFHREIGNAEAWIPNDDRHQELMDMDHHMAELMLDGKLYLAPLDHDKLSKVLDVGTGTGMWAIDFADAHPNAEVLGTDVSPIQPTWIPPNVKFELDDANLNWTWGDNTFDFIHTRFLVGSIADWSKFYREAFRCCKPGGWFEHQEPSALIHSESLGVPPENSPLDQMAKVYWEGGRKFGRTFRIYEDEIQRKGMEEAGFTDIVIKEIKVPLGTWPRDEKQKQLGQFAHATITGDLEGYLLYMCSNVLGWTPVEVQVFCAHIRHQLRQPGLNPYVVRRIAYGRKPE
ncbi:hypothetical protein VTI74DRAFT_7499 [Chaetomium olivicolor]